MVKKAEKGRKPFREVGPGAPSGDKTKKQVGSLHGQWGPRRGGAKGISPGWRLPLLHRQRAP